MKPIDELIEKYFSGNCSESEKETIIQWLKESEENRKEWLDLRILSGKNSYLQYSDPKHLSKSYQEIEKERVKRKQLEQAITRKVYLRTLKYAACFILLISGSFLTFRYVNQWQHPKMKEIALSENESARQIILSDSTRIWLSANSRISYPDKFGKKERNVYIEGKAYFEVCKDIRPFIVNTELFKVKVLGTSFEINTFQDHTTSDVILEKGSVEILNKKNEPLAILVPNQQIEINNNNLTYTLKELDSSIYTGWHKGKLEFDGQTFADIIKVLERYYHVKIIVDENLANEKQLVGSLSFQKDIHEMMKTIELVVPIQFDIQTNTVVYINSKQVK